MNRTGFEDAYTGRAREILQPHNICYVFGYCRFHSEAEDGIMWREISRDEAIIFSIMIS
jgi:hypothetical protein